MTRFQWLIPTRDVVAAYVVLIIVFALLFFDADQMNATINQMMGR